MPLETVAKALALPCSNPPRSATHWTGGMVAAAVGVSLSAVQRLWNANRLQPHRLRLPLKPGKCATLTHDYKRNGTTTLFAARNILDGTVLRRCMQKHRHQEFIKFLG